MPRLFKPTYTKPVPKTAKIIKRQGAEYARLKKRSGQTAEALIVETKRGLCCRVEAEKWYGEFHDAGGTLRRIPLSADRNEAERLLGEKLSKAGERRRWSPDRRTQLAEYEILPLADHLEAYARHLQNLNNTERYVREIKAKILKILDGCGFEFADELETSPVEDWLAEQR